jgi:hypothetical protein
MLDTIALVYYVGFYGLFLLLGVGHLMNPYVLPGAYDVPADTVEKALSAFKGAGGQNEAIRFTYMMVTRIEGAVWLAMASGALYVLLTNADRRPVFVNFAVAGICAAAIHAHHVGLLGPKPAYAMDHPFNYILLVADSIAAILAIVCLARSSELKNKVE